MLHCFCRPSVVPALHERSPIFFSLVVYKRIMHFIIDDTLDLIKDPSDTCLDPCHLSSECVYSHFRHTSNKLNIIVTHFFACSSSVIFKLQFA